MANPTTFSEDLKKRFPSAVETMEKVQPLIQRVAEKVHPSVVRNPSLHALGWRCKGLASVYELRAAELANAIVCLLNKGSFLAAVVLLRALLETVAAVIFAKSRIGMAIESKDRDKLTEVIERLTVGSRAEWTDREKPSSYNVLTMIKAADKCLADEFGNKWPEGELKRNYEHWSEFAHPSLGSNTHYQKSNGAEQRFSADEPNMPEGAVGWIVSGIGMCLAMTEQVAAELANTEDLSSTWPDLEGGGET